MNNSTQPVENVGKDFKWLGIATVIAGVLSMMAPALVGVSVVLLIGVLVAAAGVARMLWAFRSGSLGKGLLVFAIGALTLLGGIVLMANPLLTSGLLTTLLAVYFVADGICEIAAGFQGSAKQGRGWLIFGGVVSLLLGFMIWQQFPLSGIWAIGVLLGIKLLFSGMMMLTVGSTVRAAGAAS